MTEIITSSKNPTVQRVRELLAQRKKRDEENVFVVEGVRLAEEALAAHRSPSLLLYSGRISERGRQLLKEINPDHTRVEEVDADLLDRVSDTTTSQGLLMVLEKNVSSVEPFSDPVLVLDQMRDPGNSGHHPARSLRLRFPDGPADPRQRGSLQPQSAARRYGSALQTAPGNAQRRGN